MDEPLEIAGVFARNWTEFAREAEASESLVGYILASRPTAPWPALEHAQLICRSILARRAAMEVLE